MPVIEKAVRPGATRARKIIGPVSLAALCLLLGAACGEDSPEAAGATTPSADAPQQTEPAGGPRCTAAQGVTPVCGFRNPEDLAVVPGGEFLLVSEMGAFLTDAPGALSLLDIAAEQRQGIDIDWSAPPPEEQWGEADCPTPRIDRFSPHGIHLRTRSDGRHQLLVVNHGDERIEFLELIGPDPVAAAGVDPAQEARSAWHLRWRGCATPPGDPFINDVAGLPGGGFVATHMWDKDTPFDELVARLDADEPTGWVWHWQPGDGFRKVPGSDDLMPNGIAASPDGRTIFVNIYMGRRTVRMDLASGAEQGAFDVPSPDNIEYGADGQLWVASHLNDPIEESCEAGHAGPCLLPFQVLRADPETMEAEVVFRHEGEPMGFATVALPHAGRIWLGTASGDRLASIEAP